MKIRHLYLYTHKDIVYNLGSICGKIFQLSWGWIVGHVRKVSSAVQTTNENIGQASSEYVSHTHKYIHG